MAHRDITLTKNARSILEGMPSVSSDDAMDYLDNGILRNAADAGQPLRLFATGQSSGTWMETRLDENANVDIQLWQTPIAARVTGSGPVACPPSNFKLTGLAQTKNNLSTLEFRREQGVVARMAYAALHASAMPDLAMFQSMMDELGKYVPWVEQINTLSHRVHGAAKGPHVLNRAIRQMSLFAELVDEQLVRSMASPCTTAQALLAVHASVHEKNQSPNPQPGHASPSEPGLYALESPGMPTTHLFVQPDISDVNNTIAAGTHIWLDHTGAPIFLNELKKGADARYSELSSHPDPDMAAVQWMPDGPGRYGMLDTLTDWSTLMQQGFNPQTRALCAGLAAATPRALGPTESLAVVQAWMASTPATGVLWADNKSKVHRTTLVFDTSNKSHLSLAMWGQYAAGIWADHHAAEHAVLDTLLPKMETLGAIEEWRMQMRAMDPAVSNQKHAQQESYAMGDSITSMETTA